jgi:hypothetical protein
MKKADLIVLSHTVNENIFQFQQEMLMSFLKNTPSECKMFVLENNSTPEQHFKWKELVLSSGQSFYYCDEPFNMNHYYNIATRMTENEYIFYCNSDLIYHEGWYVNLLEWFDKIPNLFTVSPFTKAFDWDLNPQGVYQINTSLRNEFFETESLPGWINCIPRKYNFIWDEQFVGHYQDGDFCYTVADMKQKNQEIHSGIAYNSRVDHIGGATSRNCTDSFGYGGFKKLKEKWKHLNL